MDSEQLKKLKAGFDVRVWLQEIGVRYEAGGSDWVNMRCPFCYDSKAHLGVNLKSRLFSCWICGEKGDAVKLVREFEGLGFQAAVRRLWDFQTLDGLKENDEPELPLEPPAELELPPEAALIIPGREHELVLGLLARRGFPRSFPARRGCYFCQYGRYALRMLVPVVMDGRTVNFIAVDTTGKASLRYLTPPDDEVPVGRRRVLYGLPPWGPRQVVLVEGVFDAWRVGNQAVALLGKNWSQAQLRELFSRLRPEVIVKVALDGDAEREARALAAELTARFRDVRLCLMEPGLDPDTLEAGELAELVKIG